MSHRFDSASSFVAQAEKQRLADLRQAARAVPLSVPELVAGLRRQIESKCWWIDTHGRKRPAHELEQQRHNLSVLVQAHDLMLNQGVGDGRKAQSRQG
jgi:hypothetical protein